ncbi:MAG: heavy-metal-associated domain-containing protein [Burkholderiales bacterium]|nr:heavy-metal-associated domain-containing protein [Burkholderiales bacterium]GIK86399.1 MAG: hypothetical protein BroJett026_18800 [Betaproteobacteria bacterium]
MVTFEVDDMTCGRCAERVARAIRDVVTCAEVAVDVPARLVWVDGPFVAAAVIAEAIRDAGHTPAEFGRSAR